MAQDRGKEPKQAIRQYPWFWGWDGKVDFAGGPEFTGERFNDCYYTLSLKRKARGDVLKTRIKTLELHDNMAYVSIQKKG